MERDTVKHGTTGEIIDFALLVDGLGLIEAELVRVNERMSASDRDAFAVQGKFLESRYGPDGTV